MLPPCPAGCSAEAGCQCCPLALQAAVLKLKASEVEQLEPDLVDHYNRLQSLATTLGRRLMLSDVKQASHHLLHKCKQSSLYHTFAENPVPVAGI